MKNVNKIFKSGVVTILALIACVSCEDDSLPEAGSIADLSEPVGDFIVSNSETSSLIKKLTNASRNGATSVEWVLPEGAEVTFDEIGVLTTVSDLEIFVKFPVLDSIYSVGIQATDDNNVVSDISFIDVEVFSSNAPTPAANYSFDDGSSNFKRIFTNASANDDGGVLWSVSEGGVELDINELLVTTDLAFLTQTSTDETVSINFPGSGDYNVTVIATNFDGIESSFSSIITIDPLPIPEPEFIYSSNEDYSIQTFKNTTPDTDSVIWTIPDGTFVNGTSSSDDTVEVSFPTSGTYDVTLAVTSIGIDDDGNELPLEGTNTKPTAIITSVSGIETPVIIQGDFNTPEDQNITAEGVGRTDLAKEYWLPDGVSTRVYVPRTEEEVANGVVAEQFIAYPGATLETERSWYTSGAFNRVRITSSGRTGAAAAWNPGDERAAVQLIQVVPGVDYKVTFYYSNDSSSTQFGLLALILDESVVAESDLDLTGNIISQERTDGTFGSFVEDTISFNSADRTAIKLYFSTTDIQADFRLDDVSIAID